MRGKRLGKLLRGLINWAMGEQIRKLKEEVHINAMKELGLEDEMAYELYKMEQENDQKDGGKEE